MSTVENTTHARKAEAEAEDQSETKKTKLSVDDEEVEDVKEAVKPKSKAGRPPTKKPASAPEPSAEKQIIVVSAPAGSKTKPKAKSAPAPAPAPQRKKTAPADSDDDDSDDDEEGSKKKKKKRAFKPVHEIIPHARLHSITAKIIEKTRPGLRIGDDFLVKLSHTLNHYVTGFIKASHLCSQFKGLKTTNGNALALTGELIGFIRKNPYLLFELKPPSEISYMSSNQKTPQPLMLTY